MTLPTWFVTTPWACIDVESTSADPETARVVELSLLTVDEGRPREAWTRRVNPGVPIPAEATAIHGISDADVADAPSFAAIAPELARLAHGRTLLGYNAARFDVPLLRTELRRLGRAVSERLPVDVLVWVREFDRFVKGQGRHRLGATCARWGVELHDAHSAEADIRATWDLWRKIVERYARSLPATLPALLLHQAKLAHAHDARHAAWRARQAQGDLLKHAAARRDDDDEPHVADGLG